jgi:glycosyltransferase involved in cell wall biosynthesis
MNKYVCAFNRDRDSYQVPLALAESGHLEKFISDYYHGGFLNLTSLVHRQSNGIPAQDTLGTFKAFALQAFWKQTQKIGVDWGFPEFRVDRYISEKLACYSKKSNADLFIYNNYARTFQDSWNREKLKILFQFHPAPRYIASVMADSTVPISAQEPEVRFKDRLAKLSDIEIHNSNHIICASTVTKKSLVFSGYPEERISVIPYGSPETSNYLFQPKVGPLRYIFLGSGVRRKGIDYLLRAWPEFHSQTGSELYVVSRTRDKTIHFPDHQSITYIDGLSSQKLKILLSEMDALVLPSLMEGFGLVITESLSAGLHIVASENTGLVDLMLPNRLGTMIEGAVNEASILSSLLKSSLQLKEGREFVFEEAQAFAKLNSWDLYRVKIRESLQLAEKDFYK